MKFKIATLLAGEAPNDEDYMRVVNEIPEIIDSHNVHLAHFPRKTATAIDIKLANQIRNSAKNYQWNAPPPTAQLTSYGYRRNDDDGSGEVPSHEKHSVGIDGDGAETEGEGEGENIREAQDEDELDSEDLDGFEHDENRLSESDGD